MPAASAYILKVRPHRRDPLLASEATWPGGPQASEPVPKLEHSRRAPLIVLASFEDGLITHVGDGRKGASAGTGLVRLNMMSLEDLARAYLNSRQRAHELPFFMHRYNWHRPHASIGRVPPSQHSA